MLPRCDGALRHFNTSFDCPRAQSHFSMPLASTGTSAFGYSEYRIPRPFSLLREYVRRSHLFNRLATSSAAKQLHLQPARPSDSLLLSPSPVLAHLISRSVLSRDRLVYTMFE